jgi:two-component system, response regulator
MPLGDRMAERLPQVVLVEDNIDDELIATRAIKKAEAKHELLILRDGEEAASWITELQSRTSLSRSDLPALILLDHRIPKVGGPELLGMMRKDNRFVTVPVVMLSSMAELRDVSGYYVGGANSVVQKGMQFDEFMKNLAATVDYWLLINKVGS